MIAARGRLEAEMADTATPEIPVLDPLALLSPEALRAMEELSLNLARAAVTAQSALRRPPSPRQASPSTRIR
jgi:hypothetical protein